MKWAIVDKLHINTNNVDCFKWGNGKLAVWFVGEKFPTEWDDPGKDLYKKLCHQQGIRPYEED